MLKFDRRNEKYNDFIVSNNDILLAMTGGTVGKSYYIQNLKEKMYVNQRVADIKINNIKQLIISENIAVGIK